MKSCTVVTEICLFSQKSENSQQLRVSFGTRLRILFPEISGPGNILFSLSPVMDLHRLLIDTMPVFSSEKISLKQHAWPIPFHPSYLLCVSHEEFLFPSIMLLFISLMLLLVTFLITLTKYVGVFLLRYSRKEHSSSQRLKNDG